MRSKKSITRGKARQRDGRIAIGRLIDTAVRRAVDASQSVRGEGAILAKFHAAPDAARFSEREAAIIVGRKPSCLQRWRWLGVGPRFIKDGRSVRYTKAALIAHLNGAKEYSATSEYAEASRRPIEALATLGRSTSVQAAKPTREAATA